MFTNWTLTVGPHPVGTIWAEASTLIYWRHLATVTCSKVHLMLLCCSGPQVEYQQIQNCVCYSNISELCFLHAHFSQYIHSLSYPFWHFTYILYIYIFNVNLYHTGTYYYMNIIMYNYIYILYMHVHSQYYCILSEHNYLSRYGHTLLFEYISIEHIYIYIYWWRVSIIVWICFNIFTGWWFGTFFSIVYGIILPIDELIFFKMVIAPPTSIELYHRCWWWYILSDGIRRLL